MLVVLGPGPVAQVVESPTADPCTVPYFVEIDHELISTVILLIQEGLLCQLQAEVRARSNG